MVCKGLVIVLSGVGDGGGGGGDSLELNVLSGTHGPQFVSTLHINIQWLNNKCEVTCKQR